MNIIVLGQPASGKGTQAKLLAEELDFQYLEMGDVLREEIRKGTPLGKKIDKIMHQKGSLVSDKIINKVVSEWLTKFDTKKKEIVFDGYPRKLSQYKEFEKILARQGKKIDKVIYLTVSERTSIKRIGSRRVCPRCDAEYNLLTKPPKKDGVCDQCRVKLVQRGDDRPEVVKRRLKVYHRQTEPLAEYVRQQGLLMEIDGERPIGVIHQEIKERLGQ